jgi:hypothetical protein
MANRCLLHKTKLRSFIAWLTANGIPHRHGKDAWQVLQVRIADGNFAGVYSKADMPEHYSIESRLEPVVRQFIEDNANGTTRGQRA